MEAIYQTPNERRYAIGKYIFYLRQTSMFRVLLHFWRRRFDIWCLLQFILPNRRGKQTVSRTRSLSTVFRSMWNV